MLNCLLPGLPGLSVPGPGTRILARIRPSVRGEMTHDLLHSAGARDREGESGHERAHRSSRNCCSVGHKRHRYTARKQRQVGQARVQNKVCRPPPCVRWAAGIVLRRSADELRLETVMSLAGQQRRQGPRSSHAATKTKPYRRLSSAAALYAYSRSWRSCEHHAGHRGHAGVPAHPRPSRVQAASWPCVTAPIFAGVRRLPARTCQSSSGHSARDDVGPIRSLLHRLLIRPQVEGLATRGGQDTAGHNQDVPRP